jgi:protein gp37
MGKTSIEWTDASWNPIVGCTEISPGCANCYAARLAATRLRSTPQYKNLATMTLDKGDFELKDRKPRWNGQVRFLPERLEEPLHWRKPRRIFVCDMGDLFHESVQDKWIRRIWDIMASCQQHTFQILTKRATRMRQWVNERYGDDFDPDREASGVSFAPLPNVWLGVSVENQHFADERIPLLLQTPAAVRWISAEPLLGPVKMKIEWMNGLRFYKDNGHDATALDGPHLNWVVCGGESGPNARPMHPDWARSLRDQCQAAGVPYFFKQWGEWSFDQCWYQKLSDARVKYFEPNEANGNCLMYRVGKKRAGRLLDGRTWNEFPNQLG